LLNATQVSVLPLTQKNKNKKTFFIVGGEVAFVAILVQLHYGTLAITKDRHIGHVPVT